MYHLIIVFHITSGIDDGVEFDDFIDDESEYYPEMSPGEFAQLKRLHGGDPFPVTDSFEVTRTHTYEIFKGVEIF